MINSETEKDENYLEKKDNMSPIVERLFSIIVIRGMNSTVEIGNILYEEENIDDKKKRDNVRQNRKQMYDLFLGKVKSDNKNKGYSRDEEFINYIMINEPILLHPRLKKKYSSSNFKNKNISAPLEPDSPNRLPLKARTKNRTIVTLVDYLDERCWNGSCLYTIKGSEKTGKTTEIKAFTQLCKDRGVQKVIEIDFESIYKNILKDAGSFMNWFMNKIYRKTNFGNEIEREFYKKEITDDPGNGSYEYMKSIAKDIMFDSKDNFLIIIIDNVEKLFDYPNIANVFYFYLRKVFQNLKEIRQIITYSTECYLKIDDLHSPFNVGESLTLCGFDLEDIYKLLELNNVILSEEDIKSLFHYIGASPYLWQITIPYLKESEFQVEDFKIKAIADEDIRAFFYRLCETIEKDKQLLDKIIDELLKFDYYLEDLGIRVSYILEGLGVIKRYVYAQDKWTWKISCEIYRYFLKTNISINSNQKIQKRNFSWTCKDIKIDENGILSATCMTRNGRPLQTSCNLNERIANINGNLIWSREGGYAETCQDCRIDFVGSNGDAYLVCKCKTSDESDDSPNITQLNLDKRVDNTDGELRCYRGRMDYS